MARRDGRRMRDLTWSGLGGTTKQVTAGSLASSTVVSLADTQTLLRTRGEILGQIDGPVDGDATIVGCGLIVVTEEQVAVGTTSMPDPIQDLDAEWLWHGFLVLAAQAGTGVGGSLNVNSAVARLSVDSKAMRRMKQSQSVALVLRNSVLSGTPTVDVNAAFRVLFGE